MSETAEPGKMTIWEHLDELRSRVIRSLIAFVGGVSVAWTFREEMLAWIWKPYADSWKAQNIPGDPTLNFAAPSDAFKAYFKLSMIGGIMVAAPFVFYQLWAYIAPGLYKKEKKVVLPFVFFSTILFVGGGLFGWRIAFPLTFDYLLSLANTGDGVGVAVRPVVMMGDYIDFVSSMLLGFGVTFELPLFILFLSIVGIVNYLQLIRFGRWWVLIAFTIGAIFSPPDTSSQIAMSVPLCVLYFLSIGLAYLFGKRPSKEEIARDKAEREALRAQKKAEKIAKAKEEAAKLKTKGKA